MLNGTYSLGALGRRDGIAANTEAVQRALRRERRNTHPTHNTDRHRSPKPPLQDTERKGPHTRPEESARKQEAQEERRQRSQRRDYRERRDI